VPHILPSLDTVDRLSLGRQSLGSVSVESKSPSINSYLPPSPRKSAAAAAAAWKAAQISTAILPGFPATTTGLQSITVFTAQAFKRPPSSILSGAERSPNGFRQPTGAARAWPACTLVFTLFKLSLLGHDAATDLAGGDDERTVAHVHIFSAPHATSATHRRPGRTSVAGQYDSVQPVERERRMLSSESTASVYDNYTDTEGRRRSVLSIYFENDRTKGNEWVLEMKDAGQQYECIRQIKKTATMIKAEEAGCGQAIRPLYEDATISAENLARELEVHKLAAAKKREAVANATATAAATAATGSATAEQRGAAVPAPPHPHHRPVAAPQAQVHTQVEQSRSSLDVIQSVAMGRSQSVDTPEAHPAITVSHRKSPSTESIEAAMASLSTSVGAHHIGRDMLAADDKLDLNRISALNFASTFSFPAPPSDLPQSPRSATHANATSSPTHSSPVRPHAPTNPFGARSSQSLTPSLSDDDADDEADNVVVSPPTPPLRPTRPATPPRSGTQTPSAGNASVTVAVPRPGSIASTLNSEHSSTSRLRRLRAKPQVIDIMAEFSAVEAENMPPPEDEIGAEPIREDRERKIRFA
jgi:hypothetical protein